MTSSKYGAGRDLTVPAPGPRRADSPTERDPLITYGIPPAIRRGANRDQPLFEEPARVRPQPGATVHIPRHHEAGVSLPTQKRTTAQYERHAKKHGLDCVKLSAKLQGVPVSITEPVQAKRARGRKPTVKVQVLELHARGATPTSIAETLNIKESRVRAVLEVQAEAGAVT